MYFNKNYWNCIQKLYKFKEISSLKIKKISKVKKSYIPFIFKNFKKLVMHDGKNNINIRIKHTGRLNK
jgi:ABC-type lipoprotein export system ATPase subunit